MNIVIRVDASKQIGSGHVMRCLTLADALRERGASVSFICRDYPGQMASHIANQSYPVTLLEFPHERNGQGDWDHIATTWQWDAEETVRMMRANGTVDWLIVDHYALNSQWEHSVRQAVRRILVIDDRADRSHDCNLIVDQNVHEDADTLYHPLIPAECRRLFGPRYALLRPQFSHTRHELSIRGAVIKRLLVFFGGADATNEAMKFLEAFRQFVCMPANADLEADVVLGAMSVHREEVMAMASTMKCVNVHSQVENMATMMARADVAFGAGGITTWERCCLGLPAYVTMVADNQIEVTTLLAQDGVIQSMGMAMDVEPRHYLQALQQMQSSKLREMSLRAMSLVDGLGCQRVVDAMME